MFKYFTTVVAAITPLMYFHGALFHDNYLRALGLPADLFQLSFEETLIQGFATYMMLSIPALIVLIMFLLVALGAVYNLNEASKITFVKQVINWSSSIFANLSFRDKTKGHQLTEKSLKWIYYSLVIVLVPLITLGATLGVAIKAEKLAKDSALNNIRNPYKNFVFQELQLNDGSLIKGYTFACSNFGCAVLSDNKIKIVPLAEIKTINALINTKFNKT